MFVHWAELAKCYGVLCYTLKVRFCQTDDISDNVNLEKLRRRESDFQVRNFQHGSPLWALSIELFPTHNTCPLLVSRRLAVHFVRKPSCILQ